MLFVMHDGSRGLRQPGETKQEKKRKQNEAEENLSGRPPALHRPPFAASPGTLRLDELADMSKAVYSGQVLLISRALCGNPQTLSIRSSATSSSCLRMQNVTRKKPGSTHAYEKPRRGQEGVKGNPGIETRQSIGTEVSAEGPGNEGRGETPPERTRSQIDAAVDEAVQ